MKGRVGRPDTAQGHLSWDAMRGRERGIWPRGNPWKWIGEKSYPGSSVSPCRPHPVDCNGAGRHGLTGASFFNNRREA